MKNARGPKPGRTVKPLPVKLQSAQLTVRHEPGKADRKTVVTHVHQNTTDAKKKKKKRKKRKASDAVMSPDISKKRQKPQELDDIDLIFGDD